MYKVNIGSKIEFFMFLDIAIQFAKISGVWYYITDDKEVIWTQNDDIYENIVDTIL